MIKKKRLGDILVSGGFIKEEELSKALELQQNSDKRLGEILEEMSVITDQDVVEALEFQLGIPQIDLTKVIIDKDVITLLPLSLVERHQAIPIRRKGNMLTVAMADPLDVLAIDDIKIKTKCEVVPVIATKSEIEYAIEEHYSNEDLIEEFVKDIGVNDKTDEESINRLKQIIEEAPVVRLVNNIISDGVKLRASDIHIEPQEEGVKVRYRVDGILKTEMNIPSRTHAALVSRIKIMSEMDIAERRVPQDGRIQMMIKDKEIDLRVSTLPTVKGEKVVMRILDKSNLMLELSNLGFLEDDLELFKKMINYPHGMLLLTGPTGSGKTTTLYSALSSLDNEQDNIITVENPVEYRLDGINQVQTNPKAGLTFASALRSILRQDPDIVMVGEIRDKETAEIAINAALTGHLVLSTLHTNEAAGAISRLIDMGVEPFLIASSVIGEVAQRLVRRICPRCQTKYTQNLVNKELSKYLEKGNDEIKVYHGTGCRYCNNTGYRGRAAIHEVLEIDSTIKKLILKQSPTNEIEEVAIKQGMNILERSGLEKVDQGVTTLEEVMRVTKLHLGKVNYIE